MPITLAESVGVLLAGELLLSKIMPAAAHITGYVPPTPPATPPQPPPEVRQYTPPPPPPTPVPRSNIVPTSMIIVPPDDIKLLDEVIVPDVPKPFRQCKGLIGQGYTPLSDQQILDIVKPPSVNNWTEFIGGPDASPLRRQLVQALRQAISTEQIPFNALSCSNPSQQGRSKLYTNANQALAGLNTINANVLQGQGTGALAAASIVLGFEEDGVAGGIANTLQVVAKFDPEPITRTILTVVGQFFGSIFAKHRQRVAIENAVNCATSPAVTEALYTLEQAVMDGRIYPEHGMQLLDRLYDEFQAHLNSYGLIKRRFVWGDTSWACNAGCELLWYLQAIIVKKKDKFAHLTTVPCPGPPSVQIQAPQVYVSPGIRTVNEAAVDSIPAPRPMPIVRPAVNQSAVALRGIFGGRNTL